MKKKNTYEFSIIINYYSILDRFRQKIDRKIL